MLSQPLYAHCDQSYKCAGHPPTPSSSSTSDAATSTIPSLGDVAYTYLSQGKMHTFYSVVILVCSIIYLLLRTMIYFMAGNINFV